ncbi:MAG: FAD-dependent oxidoreductase, partial [Chloroflexi bacterium]|nr:FAD-dependent oxidoreductase [Chloroflexota bacterium]
RPYAVVQLRQDNLAGTLYNLVGFQTNLKWSEQKRVFSLIPGLERAEWVRFGQMHRNTYLNAPRLIEPTMRWRRPEVGRSLYFAGQIVGTEGYIGSTASGLVAGLNAAREVLGKPPLVFPHETMIGALMHYVTHASPEDFQPMKPNFGLLPPLERTKRRRRERNAAYAERALAALEAFLTASGALEDVMEAQ